MGGTSEARNLDLTSGRANRLLRPLRTRCSSLAALYNTCLSAPSVVVTYSYTKPMSHAGAPPLTILEADGNLPLSSQYPQSILELSRRTHALCEAFKLVVEKTQCSRKDASCNNSVLNFTTMCSIIAGRHIEPELDEATIPEAEEQSMEILDSLYDSVPLAYRGWTLVSHALQLILDTCPHNATLLHNLLDITMDHNLRYHSSLVLHSLLSLALSPSSPSHPPPICHPDHSDFFIRLAASWDRKGYHVNSFCTIFNAVMDQVQSVNAWSCKATTKLLYHNRRKGPHCVVQIGCGLIRFLHSLQSGNSDGTVSHLPRTAALERTLGDWLVSILSHQLRSLKSQDEMWGEPEESIMTLLRTCYECNAHRPRQENQASSCEVVSLATLLLSRNQNDSCRTFLLKLLREVQPETSTYETLMSQTFLAVPRINEFKDLIHRYATTLKTHDLSLLEASLWACALREVERIESLTWEKEMRDAVKRYRQELMKHVEDSEKCFAELVDSRGYEWEWEPTVECWIRKAPLRTPVGKRRADSRLESGCGKRKKDRSSAFALLLSNALSNRKEVHDISEDEDGADLEEFYRHFSDNHHPSSDDGLDLFAYSTSSPYRM